MNIFFKKYISQIIIVFIILLFAVLYFTHTLPQILQTKEDIQEAVEENVTLKIPVAAEQSPVSGENTSESTVSTEIEVSQNTNVTQTQATLIAGELYTKLDFDSGDNLYEILKKNNINFEGKEYPALGFFVTDLGSLHEEAGKYLVYYINGKEATVGVSSYVPEDNDVITWELK